MARRLSRFNDFAGKLDKYDEQGEYLETIPFKFNIVESSVTGVDPMLGTQIRKGDFLIKTEDPIEPVKNRDKVRVEWRDKPYIVGDERAGKRAGDNSGRRGQLKVVRQFYIV